MKLEYIYFCLAPIDNVRRLVERDDIEYPPLFCEMMYEIWDFDSLTLIFRYLTSNINADNNDDQPVIVDEEYGLSWRQVGRWIKYKQTVEGDGTRKSSSYILWINIYKKHST